MYKQLSVLIILLSLSLISPAQSPAMEETEETEHSNIGQLGWVGLWNSEMVRWAENANQIYKLCPKSMDEELYKKCREQNLSKKTWKIPAFKNPKNTSPKLGEILITVQPGSSFIAAFKDSKNNISDFEPDLFDTDWGYGPFFHQTILQKNGNWIMLPIQSLPTPVWINPKESIKHTDYITVTKNSVYTLNSESIVITKISGDTIFYRSEQESDMWCDAGDPPKLKKSKVQKINIKQLYNSQKQLKLDIKYKRGC